MRILYYIYSLPVGGAETIVAEYLRQLRQQGAQVLLVQDYRTDSFLTRSLEEQGIPMVTLWPGSGESKLGQTAKKAARGVGLYRKFNKAIREFQPDVIHFHAFPDHMDRLDFPRSRMFYSFHAAWRTEAVMAQVLPLPFVPVMWIYFTVLSGWPSLLSSASMRDRPGTLPRQSTRWI